MCYVVDSWIEYVVVRKGVARKEMKVSGHYIAYKFIEGTLYCFDDAIVNSTQMLSEYKTNLIFYRRADIPPYAWNIDFAFITYKTPDLYRHRPYSLRGTLAISNDLNAGEGYNQPVFPEAIPLTMTYEGPPLDKDNNELNVSNKITEKNNIPQTESDTKACDDQVLDSTNPDKGNIPEHENDTDSTNQKAVIDDARSICIYVGSGDPVRVLRLLHTMNTLDTLEAFIAETYVELATTELRATVLADPLSLESVNELCS